MPHFKLAGFVCKSSPLRQFTTTSKNQLEAHHVLSYKEIIKYPKIFLPLKPKILRPHAAPKYVAPVSEKVQAKVASPFPTHVQAWLRDFKTYAPMDILNIRSDVFAAPLRRDLLHRAVVCERDCLRQGTHKTLSRGEVSGSGRKPYPQKGRGKARVGSLRAPHFVGGGRAFPLRPRDYSTRIPEKVFLHALRVLLSARYAQNQLIIFDEVDLASHRTRELVEILNQHGIHSVMFLTGQPNMYLELAVKNIPGASLGDLHNPKIYQLMLHENLILDKLALAYLEDTLAIE
ncbi:54S ribosomal protein yml6, mitochondrial [Massospora cicadina]|nr:54S ribosomal protein yml6, mitochondrial [Massospora cicadina]